MKRSGEMSGLFLSNKFGQSGKRVGGNRSKEDRCGGYHEGCHDGP